MILDFLLEATHLVNGNLDHGNRLLLEGRIQLHVDHVLNPNHRLYEHHVLVDNRHGQSHDDRVVLDV